MARNGERARGWAVVALLAVALIPLAHNEWYRMADVRARRAEVDRQVEAGRAAMQAGDGRRAVVAFQRANALARSSPRVRTGLLAAQAMVIAETPERVSTDDAAGVEHELLLLGEERGAPTADEAVALGNLAMHRGDHAAARAQYEAALRVAPSNATALYRLGELERVAGANAEAETLLRKAIEAAPEAWRPHLALGELLRAQDKMQSAADSLRRAAELDPNFATHRALGGTLVRLEKFDEAIEHLKEAARIGASLPGGVPSSLRDDLGFAYFRTGRLGDAIDELQKSVKDSGSLTSYFNLGVAYQGVNRHADAVRIFDELIGRQPGLADAHVRLTASLITLGELDHARAALERFGRLLPGNKDLEPAVPEMEKLAARLAERDEKAAPKKHR